MNEIRIYYRPAQGDTAAAVAEGYGNNFQTLDTAVGSLETQSNDLNTQLDTLRSDVDSKDAATLVSANAYTDTVAGSLVPLTDSRLSDPRDAIQHNGGGSLKLWAGTQAEYDALAAKADDTLYFIR